MKNKFYCTTAIDYPNGKPHIGHAYEKIVTDAYNRWYKLFGHETYFLTGTDENGQKLIESAKAAGKDTLQYVDENVEIFKELCTRANISNDDFIRTTEKRHEQACVELWKNLEEKNLIYHGSYAGDYCLSCEAFYTETQAPDGICPEHHKPLERKEEEGYFFKLSEYQDWIIKYLEDNPTFVTPKAKYNEILSRLKGDDLRDLAISRPTQGWGVKVPGNDKFVMYTWFDALINYYSALSPEQKNLWPADLHVVGKDILWFHSVIWPCMLKASELPLPKQVYVHGMVLAEDGKKMSKSLGNAIDPFDMLDKYPTDTFRYYMLRNISANSDGRFSEEELISKHNTELGNDYGNLLMRIIKLARKVLPDTTLDSKGVTQDFKVEEYLFESKKFMENREHHKAIDKIWELVNFLNQYINDKEPWKFKNDPEAFKAIAYNCIYGIGVATILLKPFIPDVTEKAFSYLGTQMDIDSLLQFEGHKFNLENPDALFPKIEA